jgi:hypothetical protein
MKPLFAILLSLVLLFSGLAAAESSPAEMISDFRLKHGEGHVTMDATLNRIALAAARSDFLLGGCGSNPPGVLTRSLHGKGLKLFLVLLRPNLFGGHTKRMPPSV